MWWPILAFSVFCAACVRENVVVVNADRRRHVLRRRVKRVDGNGKHDHITLLGAAGRSFVVEPLSWAHISPSHRTL